MHGTRRSHRPPGRYCVAVAVPRLLRPVSVGERASTSGVAQDRRRAGSSCVIAVFGMPMPVASMEKNTRMMEADVFYRGRSGRASPCQCDRFSSRTIWSCSPRPTFTVCTLWRPFMTTFVVST